MIGKRAGEAVERRVHLVDQAEQHGGLEQARRPAPGALADLHERARHAPHVGRRRVEVGGDVHAGAQQEPPAVVGLHGFAEQPGDLPAPDLDVVGPADLDRVVRPAVEHSADRERPGQGEERGPIRRDPLADRVEREGRGEAPFVRPPRVRPPPAALRLAIGPDKERELDGAGLDQPPRLVAGRVECGVTEDSPATARLHGGLTGSGGPAIRPSRPGGRRRRAPRRPGRPARRRGSSPSSSPRSRAASDPCGRRRRR